MLGVVPAHCGTRAELAHTHTHTHLPVFILSQDYSFSCVAGLCWGVDSDGCFITLKRVHLRPPPPCCFGMKGSDDPGIFLSLCSVELTTSYHLDNAAFCHRGYGDGTALSGGRKTLGGELWGGLRCL